LIQIRTFFITIFLNKLDKQILRVKKNNIAIRNLN